MNIISSTYENGVSHYDRSGIDLGDKKYTDNLIVNLCLVPDPNDPIAQAYVGQIAHVSQSLAKAGRSCYVLNPCPPKKSTTDSHIHATATHLVLSRPNDDGLYGHGLSSFADSCKKIVGKRMEFSVNGLMYYVGAPFDRLAKATNGQNRRVPQGLPDVVDHVIWGSLSPTQALRDVRQDIDNAANKTQGIVKCLGASGDNMMPHHTAYVDRVQPGVSGNYPSLPWIAIPNQTIPHVVAIGTCGPWGQVPKYETNPKRVADFLHSYVKNHIGVNLSM